MRPQTLPPPLISDWAEFLPKQEPGQQEDDNCDSARQSATISHPQSVALHALMAGDTVPQAAEKAAVHRGSVYRWLKEDQDFQDAYFAARADLLTAAQNRLLNMTQSALKSLKKGIDRNTNPWLAYAVLKRLGVLARVEGFDRDGNPCPALLDLIPPTHMTTIRFRPPWGGYVRGPDGSPMSPPSPTAQPINLANPTPKPTMPRP